MQKIKPLIACILTLTVFSFELHPLQYNNIQQQRTKKKQKKTDVIFEK